MTEVAQVWNKERNMSTKGMRKEMNRQSLRGLLSKSIYHLEMAHVGLEMAQAEMTKILDTNRGETQHIANLVHNVTTHTEQFLKKHYK